MQAARILLVDDNQEFLTYVSSVLTKTDYSVVVAHDPWEALERAHWDEFDLILTDVNLIEGMSGFDLVKSLRRIPKTEHVPIALVTARRDKTDVEKALDCGADDYIVKPLDPPLFLSKVEGLLEKTTQRPIHFAEGYVSMDASWDTRVHILHLTEKGMTVWSDLKAPVEGTVKLKSEFFNQLGIQPPPLRVIDCVEDGSRSHRFFITLSFIGLNEGELQKIRRWINTHATIPNGDQNSN